MSVALSRNESLWRGDVGHGFIQRCGHKGTRREAFWRRTARLPGLTSVLEVGCGVGPNLRALLGQVPRLAGADVSEEALTECQRRTWGQVQLTRASAASLPYADSSFDLVCTVGVLIHVPHDALGRVFDELARASSRYVLVVEYEATKETEIPWRGVRDILWARPHGLELWRRRPEFVPVARGTVGPQDDFDTMGWALFSKNHQDGFLNPTPDGWERDSAHLTMARAVGVG